VCSAGWPVLEGSPALSSGTRTAAVETAEGRVESLGTREVSNNGGITSDKEDVTREMKRARVKEALNSAGFATVDRTQFDIVTSGAQFHCFGSR